MRNDLKQSKWEKKGGRWEAAWDTYSQFSGVGLTLTRAGLNVEGFYDSFVGLRGFFITWEEFDALRKAMP